MTTSLPSRPTPVVLAAPSGTGKTTIANALVDRFEDFVFSVSATTRPARVGERDGVDYEFVTEEVFLQMIERDELVEWARVHGNHYGTPRRTLEKARDLGKHPVLDIDVQGARQIRERIPESVLVFIFPPSAEDLRGRLSKRGTETEREVARRLRTADLEMEEARHFDYIIVNEELDRAVHRVREIVECERHRATRALDLNGEVSRIREEIRAVLSSLEVGEGGSLEGTEG